MIDVTPESWTKKLSGVMQMLGSLLFFICFCANCALAKYSYYLPLYSETQG